VIPRILTDVHVVVTKIPYLANRYVRPCATMHAHTSAAICRDGFAHQTFASPSFGNLLLMSVF
jgi:hypothetical protein